MVFNKKIQSNQYIESLDGLRAIAILLVLVFHFKLIPGFEGGFIGVDVFFVISGYLITKNLLNDWKNQKLSLGRFYSHRIARLVPAMLAVITLVLIAGYFLLLPDEFKNLSLQAAASQIYLSNIYFWQSIGYFDPISDREFLLHTWSLSLEEQFYLLFPLVLIGSLKYFNSHVGKIILLGIAVSFALNVLLIEERSSAVFYLLPTRAWELLAGSSLAYYQINSNPKCVFKKYDGVIGLVGLSIVFFSVIFYTTDFRFPGYWGVMPVFGTVLSIYSLSVARGSFISRALSMRLLRLLGRISYSLYLVHWPINVFAEHYVFADYSLAVRFSMALVSIFLSIMIFFAVEQPSRGYLRGLERKSVVLISYSAVTCSLLLVCFLIFKLGGVEDRFPDYVVKASKFSNDSNRGLDHCADTKNLLEGRGCIIGERTVAPEMIVLGDSHSLSAYSVIDMWLKGHRKSAIFTYKLSCPPLLDSDFYLSSGSCIRHNDAVREYIEAEKALRYVFLVSTWGQGLETGYTNDPAIKLKPDETHRVFKRNFGKTLKSYASEDRAVIIWAPLPGAPKWVPKTLAYSLLSGSEYNNTYSIEEYFQRKSTFFEAIREYDESIHGVFFPHVALCGSGQCISILGDRTPIYHDDNHLIKSGAEFWVAHLNKQLSTFR